MKFLKTPWVLGSALILTGTFLSTVPSKAALPAPNSNVYLVYKGTSALNFFDPAVSTKATTSESDTVYVLTDLAFPYNYSLLTVKKDGTYTIATRVLSSNGSSQNGYDNGVLDSSADPTQNFIGGVVNNSTSPTLGYVGFRFSSTTGTVPVTIGNQTEDYLKTVQIFATGVLSGLSSTEATTIVAKDTKQAVSAPYTVNEVPAAITNYLGTVGSAKTAPYSTKLSGPAFFYDVNPSAAAAGSTTFPTVFAVSVSGSYAGTLDSTLTALANVGGSFKLKGQTSATTISPVAARLTSTSSPTVYEDFLFAVVKSLGLSPVYTPTP